MAGWRGRGGWLVLALVVVTAFVVGVARDGGPRSAAERADAIAQRVACPVCNGESVYESQVGASVRIRNEIRKLVDAGQLDDRQIVATIESRFPGTALVPRSTGLDALVWAIPTAVGVTALGGVALAMRRWRGRRVPRRAAWIGGLVIVAGLAGWAVAANIGERGSASGGPAAPTTPADPVQAKLAEARAQLGSNPSAAADAFLAVLKIDPTNAEAKTYSAWLVVLQGRQTGAPQLVEAGLAALRRAVQANPTYPDGHCFVAIASARFLATPDPATARTEAQACIDHGVNPQMRPMIESLLTPDTSPPTAPATPPPRSPTPATSP